MPGASPAQLKAASEYDPEISRAISLTRRDQLPTARMWTLQVVGDPASEAYPSSSPPLLPPPPLLLLVKPLSSYTLSDCDDHASMTHGRTKLSISADLQLNGTGSFLMLFTMSTQHLMTQT